MNFNKKRQRKNNKEKKREWVEKFQSEMMIRSIFKLYTKLIINWFLETACRVVDFGFVVGDFEPFRDVVSA